MMKLIVHLLWLVFLVQVNSDFIFSWVILALGHTFVIFSSAPCLLEYVMNALYWTVGSDK